MFRTFHVWTFNSDLYCVDTNKRVKSDVLGD